MGLALDIAYTLALPALLPSLLSKRREGWRERMGRVAALERPAGSSRRLLIHGVSVGETNLIGPLVRTLVEDGGVDVVVSATTDTGIARAGQVHAGRARVVRFPLDFSGAVRRFLDAVRPDAVALVELELWPNFAQECARRGIPVAIVNGRLSERSFKGYRVARPALRSSFASLARCAAQDEEYAARFVAMGADPARVSVLGSMKWDAVRVGERVEGAEAFAAEMGINLSRPLIVAGSTAPEEHALLRDATPEGAQLLCAPRRPEWFDDAAAALPGCARRSRGDRGSESGRFLLDTIGELRKAYALADVVALGRSFGKLHGSDPMEPAALGKPLVIGERYGDFAQSVRALRDSGALIVSSREALAGNLSELLHDAARRGAMSDAALRCVTAHQGATARHATMLRALLEEGAAR